MVQHHYRHSFQFIEKGNRKGGYKLEDKQNRSRVFEFCAGLSGQ